MSQKRVDYTEMKTMIGVVLATMTLAGCTCAVPVEQRAVTGIITKVAREGWMCKTTEGQLSVGFLDAHGRGTVSREEVEFTIEDARADLITHALRAQEHNTPVRIYLMRPSLIMTACRSWAGSFLTRIDELPQEGGAK